MRPDPLGTPRNPFHVLLLSIVTLNGLALAFGISTSLTLNSELVTFYERLYGLLLTAGASSCLSGMYWPSDPRTGLLLTRAGYLGLGLSTAIYGYAAVARNGLFGVLIMSVCWAFAATSFWYAWQANKVVRAAMRAKRG